jgi:hypothetical protein
MKRLVVLSLFARLAFSQGISSGIVQNVPADSGAVDAFGRQRVGGITPSLFDAAMQYGLYPLIWETALTGTGTATFIANQSEVRLRVAASGDIVVRQTHAYVRYQPGKSQFIVMTGTLGALTANTRQRLGYFDAQNGVFFEQDGTNLKVVQRSFVTGSAVDTAITQANWNLDKFNGQGPSGVTLDTSKSQIFVMDLQWLGVGRVRFGFFISGRLFYCHQILNANSLPGVYMSTADLPVRYEHQATGAIGGNVDMFQMCSSVITEGGFDAIAGPGFSNTANNGITAITVTTRRPILSIRPKATFNSITNRGSIFPQSYEAFIGSGSALIELVYQGTLTGPSFTSVDPNSIAEFDVAASAITGGTVLDSFYISGAGPTARIGLLQAVFARIVLALNIAGASPDNLSIVVTSFTGSVTANGVLSWKELY